MKFQESTPPQPLPKMRLGDSGGSIDQEPHFGEGIVDLDSSRQQEAAALLARAFFNDPLMCFYLTDPARRTRVLPGLLLATLRYCLFYGRVLTTPGLEGVACWLPPGKSELNPFGLLRASLGAIPLSLGFEALRKTAEVEPLVTRIHRECLPGLHWYLMVLGVDPPCQGRGIGGRLLEAPVDDGLPSYLETMTESNVAFYSRRGYHVAREMTLPANGLQVWFMIKDGINP